MSTTLHHIVFSSCAQVEPTDDQLLQLLHGSRQRNAQRGITGVLLYHAGNVLIVLEGPKAVVRALYDTGRTDARHRNVLLLSDGPVPCRTFPDWRLGFAPAQVGLLCPPPPGYLDLRRPDFLDFLAPNANPHLLHLLRDFAAVEADGAC